MNPLVSVVIPAYNASKTIVQCLESVRTQTYKNLEVHVVNDGSVDDTLVILEHYAAAHKDFNLKVYSIDNSGPALARNYAIARSKGEYVAFLDSDDQWACTKIEKQVYCFIEHPELVLLGCRYSVGIKSDERSSSDIIRISKRQLLLKNYFSTPCAIVKSSVLSHFHFELGKNYSEDYLLWLKICCNNHQCALLNEVLTYLCDKPTYGASGLSAKLWLMEKGELWNYRQLWKEHLISWSEYIGISVFSFFKYVSRVLITLTRHQKHI